MNIGLQIDSTELVAHLEKGPVLVSSGVTPRIVRGVGFTRSRSPSV